MKNVAFLGLDAKYGPSYFQLGSVGTILTTLIMVAYRVLLEASAWQGTLGKKISGIQVTDLEGNRLTLAKSLKREGCRQLLELPGVVVMLASSQRMVNVLGLAGIALGIIDLAWMARTPLMQTLHDHLAGTIVTHRAATAQADNASLQPPKMF